MLQGSTPGQGQQRRTGPAPRARAAADLPLLAAIAVAAALWIALYLHLQAFAGWLAYSVLHLSPAAHLGMAVDFFAADVPKILLLLTGIITAITVLRSYFPPERVKAALTGRGQFVGTVLAALLGTVTPFCSCSAVPLFIGFVEAGLPLAVTFAFLISSPVVNEVALVLLAGLFGWQIALLYVGLGLFVAVAAGNVIGRLHLERDVEDYVYRIKVGAAEVAAPTFRQRVGEALAYERDLLRRILPWVLAGIALGALIHGYAPTDLVVRYAGRHNPFAVPVAVLIAVPLYSNAAGTIPIVQALIGKGLPLGTALAFMMAVTAISVPELIILRRVMRPRLIAVFVGVVAVSIVLIGYVFNAVV